MPTTYSDTLRIALIGNGEQSGTWGTTTNTNLGVLLEQAITGVQTITMTNAPYTLSVFNGSSDEARNAVLVIEGTNSAVQDIIAPAKEKTYIIANNTVGGYDIRIKTSSSTGVLIPNGGKSIVYCDGTEFYIVLNPQSSANLPNNVVIRDGSGNFAANTITANLNGNLTAAAPTAPTAPPGTNTTQIATTAFVQNVAGSLGTMSTQNANNVNITGGSVTGITDLAVADGGTGVSSLTANAVVLGNGTSPVQVVAPGASGNVLTSNGTTWVSQAITSGIGVGQTWQNVSASRANATNYTNTTGKPIMVAAGIESTNGFNYIKAYVDNILVGYHAPVTPSSTSGGGSVSFIVPNNSVYRIEITKTREFWSELR